MAQRMHREADPDQPLRIEIPAKSVNETYRIIPCDSTGFLLFFKSLETVDESRSKWYFSLYDKNLQLVWAKALPILSNLDFRFSDSGNDTLTLLFANAIKAKTADQNFQVLRVLAGPGKMILNAGILPVNSEIIRFGMKRQRAWIGLNIKNEVGQLMVINMATGGKKIFQLGQGSYITLRWMSVDSSGNSVKAIVSRQVSKKVWEHYVVTYDTTGTLKNEMVMNPGAASLDFTNFQVICENGSTDLVLGSYGPVSGNSSGQKMKTLEESAGLYSTCIQNGKQKPVEFTNFLELKSVNVLMDEKDVLNLKKKALKKNKNLGEYSLDYTLLLHNIIRHNNSYLLVAEVYYPQYHTENFTDFDYYGRPYINSYSVFDGYRFTNAIISSYSPDGKFLWDNVLEIRNLVSYELSPKVIVYPDGENLVLSYLSDGKIGAKIIRDLSVVEKLDFAPVDLLFPEDKLVEESRSQMAHWYKNYFLCYGYQEIKNIALPNNNKRLVFYINKIRYEK